MPRTILYYFAEVLTTNNKKVGSSTKIEFVLRYQTTILHVDIWIEIATLGNPGQQL